MIVGIGMVPWGLWSALLNILNMLWQGDEKQKIMKHLDQDEW